MLRGCRSSVEGGQAAEQGTPGEPHPSVTDAECG